MESLSRRLATKSNLPKFAAVELTLQVSGCMFVLPDYMSMFCVRKRRSVNVRRPGRPHALYASECVRRACTSFL